MKYTQRLFDNDQVIGVGSLKVHQQSSFQDNHQAGIEHASDRFPTLLKTILSKSTKSSSSKSKHQELSQNAITLIIKN